MTSDATGYDQLASTFSPSGRLFQVEYAKKALLRSETVVGLRGQDCVVLAAEKIATTKLYESSATDRLFTIDSHIGMAIIGYKPDGLHLYQTAKNEAATYKLQYQQDIPLKHLTQRTAMYMQAYTLYGGLRPFGAGLIMSSCQSGPELFCIEPCGTSYGYFGCAMGKNQTAAKAEIEKLDLESLNSKQLVVEATKILYMISDEKDHDFELEIGFVGENTFGKYLKVPEGILQEAKEYAKAAVEDTNSDEEM